MRSEKYHFAVQQKLPVVHPEWLLASARSGSLQPEAPYLLPPFHGLRIVVTGPGFNGQVREHLSEVISELGGTLAGNLTADCTHLVAESVRGEKFLACCSRDTGLSHVRIVSCAWLEACMRTGVCVSRSGRTSWRALNLSLIHI